MKCVLCKENEAGDMSADNLRVHILGNHDVAADSSHGNLVNYVLELQKRIDTLSSKIEKES